MLEAFHNVVLVYNPKRFAFQNQAYVARMQLAVLDYNAHLQREIAKNKQGGVVYQRKYRKQTKKWDVTPVRTKKEYKYMDKLKLEIMDQRVHSVQTTRSKPVLPDNHPKYIQTTIGQVPPSNTKELAAKNFQDFNMYNHHTIYSRQYAHVLLVYTSLLGILNTSHVDLDIGFAHPIQRRME